MRFIHYFILCCLMQCGQCSFFDGLVSNALDLMGLDSDLHSVDDHRHPATNSEALMTATQLMRHHGYPAETHRVVTSDGYVLELHRIPHSRFNRTSGPRRPAVLVLHGFLSASSTWLINGQTDSLGFVLSDEGYDVWLGNLRGNRFSRRHVGISPNDWEFWNFSLDDHAQYDVPAMIDYVLGTTGQQQLTFIGHSLGATIGVLMLAVKPQYNNKVQLAVLQAPVVYARYIKNPLRLLALYPKEVESLWRLLGTQELLPSTEFSRALGQIVCNGYPWAIVCEALQMVVGGYNEELLDKERLHVFFSHYPAGSSFKLFTHLTQVFRSKQPQKYDYGKQGNLARYGQTIPPRYNISSINASIAIFWGYMDLYADQKDIEKLAAEIPSVRFLERVPFDLWTHQDFQTAKDARKHHYNRLIEVMKIV